MIRECGDFWGVFLPPKYFYIIFLLNSVTSKIVNIFQLNLWLDSLPLLSMWHYSERCTYTHKNILGAHKLANTNDAFTMYICDSVSVTLFAPYAVLYEKKLYCFYHILQNCSSNSSDLPKYRMKRIVVWGNKNLDFIFDRQRENDSLKWSL